MRFDQHLQNMPTKNIIIIGECDDIQKTKVESCYLVFITLCFFINIHISNIITNVNYFNLIGQPVRLVNMYTSGFENHFEIVYYHILSCCTALSYILENCKLPSYVYCTLNSDRHKFISSGRSKEDGLLSSSATVSCNHSNNSYECLYIQIQYSVQYMYVNVGITNA